MKRKKKKVSIYCICGGAVLASFFIEHESETRV